MKKRRSQCKKTYTHGPLPPSPPLGQATSTCYTGEKKEVRVVDMGLREKGANYDDSKKVHGPPPVHIFFPHLRVIMNICYPTCELATALCPVKAALEE
jgi:hypothetical protein